MMFARMIAPVHALGPGERVGIWLQGCSKNCTGCISPELQEFDRSKSIPVETLVTLIRESAVRNSCEGLTISGGDPFEQAEELYELLAKLRCDFNDILVYTGYTLCEIESVKEMKKCIPYIDVLVDGRYVEKRNCNSSRLYGSDNQKIYFFNKELVNKYVEYDCKKQKLELFYHDGKVIIVGIQRGWK